MEIGGAGAGERGVARDGTGNESWKLPPSRASISALTEADVSCTAKRTRCSLTIFGKCSSMDEVNAANANDVKNRVMLNTVKTDNTAIVAIVLLSSTEASKTADTATVAITRTPKP